MGDTGMIVEGMMHFTSTRAIVYCHVLLYFDFLDGGRV